MSGPEKSQSINAPLVQAPNTKIYKLHEAWATAHGYRKKLQAPSCKPEDLHAENTNQFVKAASSKHQASSAKLK
jgi:hypothetical protein